MRIPKLRARVGSWLAGELRVGGGLRDGLSHISKYGMIEIHIDELFPSLRRKGNDQKIMLARFAFIALLDHLHEDSVQLSPSLTIFLKDSRKLQIMPPRFNTLGRSMNVTPPSLYVTVRGHQHNLHPHEMYATPIARMSTILEDGLVYATYRTARRFFEKGAEETYSRYVEFEYYRGELVPESVRAWILSFSPSPWKTLA